MYILISYWVVLWLCSFAVGTTFPLSNFKTKHIFGILMARVQSLKPFGALPAPQFFLSPLKAAEAAAPSGAPVAPQVFFSYRCLRLRFPKWAPMAPLPRRTRGTSLPRRTNEVPLPRRTFRCYEIYYTILFWWYICVKNAITIISFQTGFAGWCKPGQKLIRKRKRLKHWRK